MSVFGDFYPPWPRKRTLSEAELVGRKPTVEWNPTGECDWPICFEFYPDYHYGWGENQRTRDFLGLEPHTEAFQAMAESWQAREARSGEIGLGGMELGSVREGLFVHAFFDRRNQEYRFEFHQDGREERFSLGITGLLGADRRKEGAPNPRDWRLSEPVLAMCRVLGRVFDEIVAGLAQSPGALVRVGYPGESG